MKNKLTDLNDHLFSQIERLCDEGLTGEKLQVELKRTKAVTSVAKEIIETGRLALDAQKALADLPNANARLPAMLENPK